MAISVGSVRAWSTASLGDGVETAVICRSMINYLQYLVTSLGMMYEIMNV